MITVGTISMKMDFQENEAMPLLHGTLQLYPYARPNHDPTGYDHQMNSQQGVILGCSQHTTS